MNTGKVANPSMEIAAFFYLISEITIKFQNKTSCT